MPKTQPIPLPDWQRSLARAIKTPRELLEYLQLPSDIAADCAGFPVRVPHAFAERMRIGDPNDPLLLQVLPSLKESLPQPGFVTDPVGDLPASSGNGVLQKYAGRVLIMSTAACAVHCRYCFRRHFPYSEHSGRPRDWGPVIDQVKSDNSISEAILSGGDPLMLGDRELAGLIDALGKIAHLKRLRIHTRLPIVLPERVTDALIQILSATRLHTSVVVHCNHVNELDEATRSALNRLQESGAVLFNQTVLLRTVNDNAAALISLSEGLFEAGVVPYYLHLLDRVQGSAHFEVNEQTAGQLMETLRRELPGYLVPKLVREESGGLYKSPR